MKIGLVSCSKAKLDHPAPARDLYSRSALFRGARCYVERTCDRWFVLSAKHGLVGPDQVLEPYDQTLNDAGTRERRAWSEHVLTQISQEIGELRGSTFQVHAGVAYLNFGLIDALQARGAILDNPVNGLGLGRRLGFYSKAGCL